METVQVIVEAAARILETAGLDGFSTNAVAERAGVSIGSLYQYFPRKEALIGALIARETALLLAEARAANEAATGSDAMARLIQACVSHQFRRPALARVLDFEEARMPLDTDIQEVGERFERIVAAVLQRPDMPPQADPAVASRDVVAIIKGMVDVAGVNGEIDQGGLALRVARGVFGYLGSEAAKSSALRRRA